ncbi:MAG: hypothetical protein IMF09_05065 [Proteobacteria bacterium]|nr:hypothetical protein [Pseudomonadota bacterium]
MQAIFRPVLAVLLVLIASTAHAYIGPGAGIPVIGSLIGIIVTVVVAIGAILFWPIRKMLKRGKKKPAVEENNDNGSETSENADEVVDAVITDPKQDD